VARPAYLSRHPFDRVLAIVVALVAFGAVWFRYTTFRSALYDLGVFEQTVWKMAHGHGATSSLTSWNAFADHLSPVLLVFVPLYRLAATPVWFFAAQGLALGVAVLCVRPLAEAAGLRGRADATNALVLLAAANAAIWNAAVFDFHPTTLAVPVLLVGCTAALHHRHRDMWIVFAALIFLRDDLALAAAALALVGWTADSRTGRRMRLALVGAGFAWVIAGAQLGEALGSSRHFAVRYGYLGTSMTDAVLHPIHAAVGAVQHLFVGDNFLLIASSLIAFALLPVLRPSWLALAGFVALPNLLANDPNLHSYGFHYGAPVAPFLILAAAGALTRVDFERARRWAFAAVPIAASCLVVLGPPASRALSKPTVSAADARAAMALVRPGDVVSSSERIGTHLANRVTLLPYPYPFVDSPPKFPLDPEVLSTSRAKQDTVDVVVTANPRSAKGKSLLQRVLSAEGAADFEMTKVGDLLVFIRAPR